jgi:hypothetical protein
MFFFNVCQRVTDDCDSLTKKTFVVSLSLIRFARLKNECALRCASTTDGHPVKSNDAGGYTTMGGGGRVWALR